MYWKNWCSRTIKSEIAFHHNVTLLLFVVLWHFSRVNKHNVFPVGTTNTSGVCFLCPLRFSFYWQLILWIVFSTERERASELNNCNICINMWQRIIFFTKEMIEVKSSILVLLIVYWLVDNVVTNHVGALV